MYRECIPPAGSSWNEAAGKVRNPPAYDTESPPVDELVTGNRHANGAVLKGRSETGPVEGETDGIGLGLLSIAGDAVARGDCATP